MHPYIKQLAQQFLQHADPNIAAGQRAYMRNQFTFVGLKTPLRRQLSKAHMKKALPDYAELAPLVKELWHLPGREYQYVAIELVAALKKQWTKDCIDLSEYMITHKSWWDTVDAINTEISGPYFLKFPDRISSVTGKWNTSDNIWLQRSSILFQKSYKANTDTKLLAAYILQCAGSEEFFIQKAIGWALRDYSATNPAWVQQFVKKHPLPPLSKREAIRNITITAQTRKIG